jgi:hypothetical protein
MDMGVGRRSQVSVRWAAAGLVLAAGGCLHFSASESHYDSGLDGLDIVSVQPAVLVPGTTLVIEGRSFADQTLGATRVLIRGTANGEQGARGVTLTLTPRFVDFDHLEIDLDDELIGLLGGDAELDATVQIEIDSHVDFAIHTTRQLPVTLSVRTRLTPRLDRVLNDRGLLFVNDRVLIEGDGLFLGSAEGATIARVEGCFQAEGAAGCAAIEPVELPVAADRAFDRTAGAFLFDPAIAGIRSGSFRGEVSLENRHAGGTTVAGGRASIEYDLIETTVFAVTPGAASLGQYVEVIGGGFVAAGAGSSTLIRLAGVFTPDGDGRPLEVDLLLVPEFVDGRKVRYVISEDDSLSDLVDLRTQTGVIAGQLEARVSYGEETITGNTIDVELRLAPVKQVVHIVFTPQYVGSLRHYGLRAVDERIRRRVVEVVERDYRTVNLEMRRERPGDFALYAEVEIGGPDPNGLGLLGYDNTPGKDVGNVRLHDRIGGVNATTQLDGFPGYGGVFIESMFVFSANPGKFAHPSSVADSRFDDIFDPFRPDRGGRPVRAADLHGLSVPVLDSGEACPATDRATQIACAVFVLGNLIGTTVSHELGHSVGLANPHGGDVHHLSDAPNRLMDQGVYRPFLERAELHGQGPAEFCDEEYRYLRVILPTALPEDPTPRPDCS